MTRFTIDQIVAKFGNPKKQPVGYEKIQRFCDVVDAGNIPDAKLLSELSEALKEILDEQDRVKGLEAFGKKIGLNKKRGVEQEWRESDIYPRVLAAFRVNELIQAGEKEIVAVQTVMKESGRKESTIRAWATEYEKEAKGLKSVLDSFQKNRD
jgi:hypothetical protein